MRELRLSIPFVGGITAIYTREEIDKMKANAKASITSSIDTVRRVTCTGINGLASNLTRLADKLDSK